jgi:polyisoprenoid-binding protein YceI
VSRSASYDVDIENSRIYVKVGSATRLGHEHGVEGKLKSGKVALGGDGDLVFDMGSFTADTARSRTRVGLGKKKVSQNEAKKVTATMQSAEVLDVAHYPTASYHFTSIAPLDKQRVGEPGIYQVQGKFTLHDVNQDLSLKVKLERSDKEGHLRMTGTFTIRQSDYGITPASSVGGLAKVADELEIYAELILSPAK